jgi:hypothetical protein
MGWTFIDTPTKPDLKTFFAHLKPLAAAVVGSTYYAAINGEALVILTQFSKKRQEFGWKMIPESHGPHEANAPLKVLRALGPPRNADAANWRQRCLRPKLTPGDTVRLPYKLNFGTFEEDTFTVINGTRFTPKCSPRTICRIPPNNRKELQCLSTSTT